MNMTALIIGLVIAVLWLVGCCILIGKIGKKGARSGKYTLAVILFIICAGLYCGAQFGAAAGKKALQSNAVIIEDYVKKNHGNSQLVRSGVDVSEVPQAINDLEKMVPQLPGGIGDSGFFLVKMYQNAIARGFNMIRERSDSIIRFTGEDKKVTSSTIIKAVEWEIGQIINRIVTITTISAAAILTLVLCIFLIMALKKKKEPQNQAAAQS